MTTAKARTKKTAKLLRPAKIARLKQRRRPPEKLKRIAVIKNK